ncbi:MAG TPA: hypothetical protein VFS27_00580 [Blastocatellia bacterium]|jgi:hypothetical protein|nr:hypothetical protein [Blastocatellia bacterium]
MEKARRTALSAALFALICFFLPWAQASCLGARHSASGFDLARDGRRALWLAPLLMIAVLAFGLARAVWDRMPAMFTLSGMSGGLVSAWLMYYERRRSVPSSSLIATFWTTWYWLGLVASLVVAAASLWFYIRRARAP